MQITTNASEFRLQGKVLHKNNLNYKKALNFMSDPVQNNAHRPDLSGHGSEFIVSNGLWGAVFDRAAKTGADHFINITVYFHCGTKVLKTIN